MNSTPLISKADHLPNQDVDVLVLVLWLGCLVIGVAGFVCPYPHPHPPTPVSVAKVEMLNVQLTKTVDQPPPPLADAPKVSEPVPDIPQPMAVAAPSPAIAFALPVARPVRLATKTAMVAQSNQTDNAPTTPAPQTLTFGEGEGQQPAPDYPARARREGQAGDVTVRFTVNSDGLVTAAEAVIPSPWFLLNNAAVNTVQTRWHFAGGRVRVYDVVIHFELTQ